MAQYFEVNLVIYCNYLQINCNLRDPRPLLLPEFHEAMVSLLNGLNSNIITAALDNLRYRL